jgi:uncharacterized membrane protein
MGNIATTENAGWLGLGWLTSLGLSALFAFYPAFILCIAVSRMFMGEPDPYVDVFPAQALSVISFLVIIGVIVLLVRCEQYFIVLMMYLITLWPFLNIIGHWANAGETEHFPLPIDWCFLW